MSERPSRPRRSAAASYTHLLEPISLTSSSSSENDSDSDDTKRAKRLKKARTSFVPEQDSESEFEAPVKEQAEEEEEEDSDDAEALAVSEEDDGPSGQGEEDMSDIATSGGELDLGSPGPSRRGGKSGGARKRRNGADLPENAGSKAPRRSLVVTKGGLPALGADGGGEGEPVRAKPSRLIAAGLDPQYSSLVPHYLPQQLKLSKETSSYSTARVIHSTKKTKGQTDQDSSTMMEKWTAHPFAPEKTLIRDVGWEKGKWKEEAEDGEYPVNARWGGWYPEVKLEDQDCLEANQSDIDSRLPSQTFHSRPLPFRDLSVSQTESKGEENETEETDPSNVQDGTSGQTQQDPLNGKRQVFVGRINGEGEQEITLDRFESIPLNSFVPRKPGHLLNVGGPVSALSWLPRLTGPSTEEYLAISTISSPSLTLSHPANLTGSKSSSLIQIWSLSTPHPEQSFAVETSSGENDEDSSEAQEGGMRFEMGLLLGENEGEARDLQWCPRGGIDKTGDEMDVDENGGGAQAEKMGILAGVFTDGKVKVFVVPTPETVREKQGKSNTETVYVKAKKVLELTLPNTSCLSFAWGSWEMIAAGCLNGYVAVWDIGDALRKGLSSVRPTHYIAAHTCAIRSIAFVTSPPPSTALEDAGAFELSGDPNRVATVGYDGSTAITDLRDSDGAGTVIFLHERSSTYAVAWCPQSGCVYADDQDDRVRAYFLKSADYALSKRIGAHRGTIWSLATSNHHPFVLSSSSDGTVLLHSGVRALRRRRVRGHFSQKLYSLEFDRADGKWRMKDNWQVDHRSALDSIPIGTSKSSKSTGETPLTSILAWPEEIQINKVCWHPNMERSALVASGGNWGCVRIDWVEGVEEI
ncbi:transcription factor TFIIIC subunit TFC6 [Sporobolomyces salmoneus]|uniref:transcription factor TFIIIC subunit TFC6 n=1 Tax=Sporobolomyces salmoneus TaxID=183962 RepID=UPI003181E121